MVRGELPSDRHWGIRGARRMLFDGVVPGMRLPGSDGVGYALVSTQNKIREKSMKISTSDLACVCADMQSAANPLESAARLFVMVIVADWAS